MSKIVLIEDDAELATMIESWLRAENHKVDSLAHGWDGLAAIESCNYDVIILDWDLPGISGIELCKKYRQKGGASPVLILTGKSGIDDKEVGLDCGADDYLTKPFNMRELSARIRALLRRSPHFVGNILKVSDLELNPETFAVSRNGVEIQLVPKEFALLELFMRNPNKVFSPDAIISRIWGLDSDVTTDNLRSWIKRLRQKIDADKDDSIIRNIYGVGYQLKIDSD